MELFENKIEISVNEYINLRQKAEKLDNILKCIMKGANLNYNKKELEIKSDETLMNYIKIVEFERYNNRFTELGGEKDD